MSKIHLVGKNEAVALPEADGYLVQYKFKNFFKDFRLGDCMYAKDLNSLDALAKSNDDMTVFAFYFTVPKKVSETTVKEAVDFLRGKGCDVEYAEDSPLEIKVYAAREVKVWPLKDGEPVPTGITLNLTMDHKRLSSKEYGFYTATLAAAFSKKFPDFKIGD